MHYTFKKSHKIPFFKTKHKNLKIFKNYFFPSTIFEWNKLDPNLEKCNSYNVFKSNVLKFTWSSSNSFFDSHNPIGSKYITQIQRGLSNL